MNQPMARLRVDKNKKKISTKPKHQRSHQRGCPVIRLQWIVFSGSLKETRKLNIASGKRFADAMRSFQESNKEATRAFNNEALSTEDRIMATKLRVVSRLKVSKTQMRQQLLVSCTLKRYNLQVDDGQPFEKCSLFNWKGEWNLSIALVMPH